MYASSLRLTGEGWSEGDFRVDQFADFDPRAHYALTVSEAELTAVERAASAGTNLDDIQLEDV